MDGTTVMRLVVFGLCIVHSCCYQVSIIVKESKTWREAQSYCRKKYDDLITINSKEDAEALGKMLSNPHEDFWIGLYGNFLNFNWSLVQEGFYEEGQEEYMNWQLNQPNEDHGTIVCANIAASGVWSDSPCSVDLEFVCYDDQISPTPINQHVPLCFCVSFEDDLVTPNCVSEKRYHLVNEKMNWTNAQIYCRKHHTDLARIRNEMENRDIASMLQCPSWIGYYRLSWLWSDGQSRHIDSFNNWGMTEPSKVRDYCATTNSVKWTESMCSSKYPFICSATMKKRMRIKFTLSTPDSSTNLKDISAAILRQFNETLKKNQISEQVWLKWTEQPHEKTDQMEPAKTEKQELDCETG